MAKPSRRKRRATSSPDDKSRPGLPDPASVLSEKAFTSPAGRTYRILRTTERDAYDPPQKDARRRGGGRKRQKD